MRVALYRFSRFVQAGAAHAFRVAGIFGRVTFIAVDGIGAAMEVGPDEMENVHRASAARFLYLEVLDASSSFGAVTGLIGAGFIGLSLWSSIRYRRSQSTAAGPPAGSDG
jgi:hypothetical protein